MRTLLAVKVRVMANQILNKYQTLEFLIKYKSSLQKAKNELHSSDDQNMPQIIETIIHEIDLFQKALEAHPKAYNFIWLLAKYTIGVPKLFSERQINYDIDANTNANFQAIHASLCKDFMSEGRHLNHFLELDDMLFMINMGLILISMLLVQMMTPCSIYAVTALLPLYPVIVPYIFVLNVVLLIFMGLQVINGFDINSLARTYANLSVCKYPKNPDTHLLFFQPNNEVLKVVEQSFIEQQFKI
jgi:hypothetical protein